MDERAHAERGPASGRPDAARKRRASTRETVPLLDLQRAAGNAAVTARVESLQPGATAATLFRDDTPGATATPPKEAEQKPKAPIAPETKKEAPEHPSPPKL